MIFCFFIYAPSKIEKNRVIPTAEREIYVFPQAIVEATPKGDTGKNFNPKYVEGYQRYKNNFKQILEALNETVCAV